MKNCQHTPEQAQIDFNPPQKGEEKKGASKSHMKTAQI